LSAFRTAISYRFVGWLQENADVFALHKRPFRACLNLNKVQVPLSNQLLMLLAALIVIVLSVSGGSVVLKEEV